MYSMPLPAQTKSKGSKKDATGVADYRSKSFLIRTDLSPDEAKDLLKRLETMISLVEKYFERKLASPIGMIVVNDLQAWPSEMVKQFEPSTLEVIEKRSGLTILDSKKFGAIGQLFGTKAVIYATPTWGSPQHESIHAYCFLTFGRVGPRWYSEGMAEIGQYWADKKLGVDLHISILKYLQAGPPRELIDIVDSDTSSPPSREDHRWWWCLCHMMTNNPNYAAQFKSFGQGLMNGKETSFASVFGPVAKELSFEYQFFLSHIDQGYRVDLCAWDWKAKAPPCKGGSPFSSKIDANRGWQPARISVEAGQSYDYSISGTWKTSSDGKAVDANGANEGAGCLVGVTFDDYKLSEPFRLGTYGTFTPAQSGALMLRCEDKWNELADNTGKMQVRIKITGKGNPLPTPEITTSPN